MLNQFILENIESDIYFNEEAVINRYINFKIAGYALEETYNIKNYVKENIFKSSYAEVNKFYI